MKMKAKRVKYAHINGWLALFMTEPVVEVVARHLETRDLFRFLLGVSKVLRERATKSPRWNRIMQYGERVSTLCMMDKPYSEKQNILAKFLTYQLYDKNGLCSLCFKFWVQYTRPDAYGLRCCEDCGVKRGFLVGHKELASRYLNQALGFSLMKCPRLLPFWDELSSYHPTRYRYDSFIRLRPGEFAQDMFRVIDVYGVGSWARPK
jgi:hypothetical protein